MPKHLVIGAGPTGTAAARLLAATGDEVRLAARTAPRGEPAAIEAISLDARDVAATTAASHGAATILLCAMPAYNRWPEEFPPLLDSALVAAERTGARLAIVSNIYGYGDAAPTRLTEQLALRPSTRKGAVRAAMWERALASGVPVTEVRGSDYLGHRATSLFTLTGVPPLRAGAPAQLVGDLDVSHPWTFTEDVARTLVAAVRSPASWGRAFHVPSQHASQRALAERLCALAGAPAPTLARLSAAELAALGRANAILNEVIEMTYLMERPWQLDASDAERLLGVTGSSLDAMLRDTLRPSG